MQLDNQSHSFRQLGRLDESRIFSNEEALEMIPLLMVISTRTKKELNNLNAQIAHFKNGSEKAQELQNKINSSMQTWSEKIRRLGAVPVSLCKVKIPGEAGQFYWWEYPEAKLFLH